MNRFLKRVIATICALVLVLGSISVLSFASNIGASETKNAWTIYSGDGKKFDVAEGLTVKVENAKIDLSESTVKKDDLLLYVKFYIKNQDALDSFKTSGFVELAQDTCDKSELFWRLSEEQYKSQLKIGDNEFTLKLSEASPHCTGGSDYFTVEKPINWFRIYTTTDAKTGQELYTQTDAAVLKEVKLLDGRTAGLNFGEARTYDTHLQLSNPIAEVPQTIEASIKKEIEASDWKLGNGFGTKVDISTVPDRTNGPDATENYYKLDKKSSILYDWNNENQWTKVDASACDINDLAIGFWCYNGNTVQEPLAFDDVVIGVSNNEWGLYTTGIRTQMKGYTLNPGWNYVEIPLSTMQGHGGAAFSISKKIQSFTITWGGPNVDNTYVNDSDYDRYFTDFELVVMEEKEEKVQWKLGNGFGTQVSIAAVPDFRRGPGLNENYYKLGKNSSLTYDWSNNNQWTQIDASAYKSAQLAVGFWCYNGNSVDEPLAFDDVVIGVSNNEWGLYTTGIRTQMKQYTLKPGWNYVEIPLSIMEGHGGDAFSLNKKIQSFTITWGGSTVDNTYDNDSNYDRFFTDFKLVVTPKVEKEWKIGNGFGTKVDISTVPDRTGGPGTNETYYKLDKSSSIKYEWDQNNQWIHVDASDYELSELAIRFWCYNGNSVDEPLAFDDVVIGVSNNEWGLYTTGIRTQMKQYTLKPGWNYVEIPLNIMEGHGGDAFSIAKKIQSFTITWGGSTVDNTYDNDSAFDRYFTDFKLSHKRKAEVVKPNVQVKDIVKTTTVDAKTLASNEMIFSNTNISSETNPYALFLTPDGYPALVWGNKQFTLTTNVATGAWVDIAVVRDADKHINFYIDGKFIAKSNETAEDMAKPVAAHRIGADGAGGQIFKGRLADLRLWNDIRTEQEIKDNRVAKDVGVITSGISGNAQGLIGNWFLVGDIQYVLESMPDSSENKNTAVYRGSRVEDWIDYTIPSAVGDDYWSMVFVPDIQNLTNAADYNETWKTMADWIADNVDDENIKHVIGAGDSTWGNNDEHYGYAMNGFNKFKDLVSWSNLIGNHDYVWGKGDRDSTMYQKYFGEDAIQNSAAQETYVGYFKDPAGKTTTENSYYRFSVNGVKWMILQLEYHPRQSVLDWAKTILEKHDTDNVILATHAYLTGDGTYANNAYMDYINEDTDNASGGYIGDTTEKIWADLKAYSNIKLILCGHSTNGTGAVVEKTETNAAGQSVPALMINAQDSDAGDGYRDGAAYYTTKPLGMLGILRFSKDSTKVALQYYSPTEEKSFSPKWNGNRDSNAHEYVFTISQCKHTNTTMLVNENEATSKTDGYTGDLYCTDCQQIIEKGTLLSATGVKDSMDDSDIKGNTPAQKIEETKGAQKETDGAQTGDLFNPVFWGILLVGAGAVVVHTKHKLGKEESE